MQKFFAPEYVADWTCDNCKNKGGVASSRYGVPPNIIAISLKRFQRLTDGNILKIGYPLEVPLDFFNINAFVGDESNKQDHIYDAVSIACHTGEFCPFLFYFLLLQGIFKAGITMPTRKTLSPIFGGDLTTRRCRILAPLTATRTSFCFTIEQTV